MFVLDTNILVAALHSRNGASNALLRRALEGTLEVAISVALFLEYEAVLKRGNIQSVSWATATEIDDVLDALAKVATRVAPIRFKTRPMLADPDDEMVLECAMQAGAQSIVTLNAHDFGGLRPWPGIEVITPGALLKHLKLEKG